MAEGCMLDAQFRCASDSIIIGCMHDLRCNMGQKQTQIRKRFPVDVRAYGLWMFIASVGVQVVVFLCDADVFNLSVDSFHNTVWNLCVLCSRQHCVWYAVWLSPACVIWYVLYIPYVCFVVACGLVNVPFRMCACCVVSRHSAITICPIVYVMHAICCVWQGILMNVVAFVDPICTNTKTDHHHWGSMWFNISCYSE